VSVRALSAVVLLAGAVGCTPTNDPNWPFREQPVGPGLERAAGGRLVEVLDESGETLARARFSHTSARFYGEDAARIGRLRPDSEQWAVIDRTERLVCTARLDLAEFSLECGDTRFAGVRGDGEVTLTRDGRSLLRVTATAEQVEVQAAAGQGVRCDRGGSVEGSTAAASLRTGVLPEAGCYLAATLDEDPLTHGALAWLVWRLITAPPLEAEAALPISGSGSGSGSPLGD
jgi:hypothetical protein